MGERNEETLPLTQTLTLINLKQGELREADKLSSAESRVCAQARWLLFGHLGEVKQAVMLCTLVWPLINVECCVLHWDHV